MVKDGFLYGVGFFIVAAAIAYFTSPWWAVPPLLLAAFIMWFFRDPNRAIPSEPGVVVSPADGKVTHITPCQLQGRPATRISIFLNVFDVHVNRSPIAGTIQDVQYQKGKFLNAMSAECAEQNEQNRVTIDAGGETVFFFQIAGLIARRIVFTKSAGQAVERGERVGMIKFGSRTDVVLPSHAQLVVNVGDRVKGGSSLLARFPQAGLPGAAAPDLRQR